MKSTTGLHTARKSKVVKRPARGFHRFHNGIINTAPKGREEKARSVPESALTRVYRCRTVNADQAKGVGKSEFRITTFAKGDSRLYLEARAGR